MTGSRDSLLFWEDRASSRPGDAPFTGGSIAAPAWLVILAGVAVVLAGLLYFVWRVRTARRAPRSSHPSVKRG